MSNSAEIRFKIGVGPEGYLLVEYTGGQRVTLTPAPANTRTGIGINVDLLDLIEALEVIHSASEVDSSEST